MALCPLCSGRPAKRYCPAKGERICAVCCGEKREIEIYCPGDCTYLQAAHSYEDEKRAPDNELTAKASRFDGDFVYKFSSILDVISRTVIEQYGQSQWLVDRDVVEVYKALAATMKTLSSGIHYESLPEGHVQQTLFHRLKELLEQMMQPQEALDRRALKVGEAMDVLEFLSLVAEMNSSARPKSRRYLDWLTAMMPSIPDEAAPSGGLILP